MYSAEEIERKRIMALERRKCCMQKKTLSSAVTAAENKLNFAEKRKSNTSPVSAPPHYKKVKQFNTMKPANFFINPIETIKGVCRMITMQRFDVNVPYHQPLIDLFKKFTTRSYGNII